MAEGYAAGSAPGAEPKDEPTFSLQSHFEVCRVWPADFPGFGRGMRCTQDVKKGEEFLAIPVEKLWTAAAAKKHPEIAKLGEALEYISEYSLIALHMLVVRNQGSEADDFYKGHLALLQSAEFTTLMDWDEKELQLLEGSKWAMVARACKEDIREEYEELAEAIGEFFTTFNISEGDFLWAHRILMSRGVQFFNEDESMLYVLGCADLFNHSVDVPVGNDDVQLRRSDSGEQLLVVRACRDYRTGEQAFFSYSDASNGRLLMMAGFVVADNPFDSVELCLTFPVTQLSLPCYLNLAECLDAGVRTQGTAVAEETKAEFLETLPPDADEPKEVALHVRLTQAALSAQLERILAFFRLEQLCRGGKAPAPEELAASDTDAASREKSLKSLKAALTSMQKNYPGSLEADQVELVKAEAAAKAGVQEAKRREMALRVLIGEKLVFHKALEFLEQRLSSAWSAEVD